jgi:hypothetical protein
MTEQVEPCADDVDIWQTSDSGSDGYSLVLSESAIVFFGADKETAFHGGIWSIYKQPAYFFEESQRSNGDRLQALVR